MILHKPFCEASVKLFLDIKKEGLSLTDILPLKSQTQGKRSAGVEPVKFDIKDSTNIKLVTLKILLSHIEIKSKLTE